MVINKSADTAFDATISLSGFTPLSAATSWSYGPAEDQQQSASLGRGREPDDERDCPHRVANPVRCAGHSVVRSIFHDRPESVHPLKVAGDAAAHDIA